MSSPKGPFRLVTVNTAPERAKRLIGRVAENLKDQYTIIHVDNCESQYFISVKRISKFGIFMISINLTYFTGIAEVETKVKHHQPDVLVSPGLSAPTCLGLSEPSSGCSLTAWLLSSRQ